MVGKDQNQMCSNSSSGGGGGSSRSTSKKLKQKKVPQRGLGVAQLEKIRIEEQQKKDVFSSPSTLSPTNSSSLPLPNYPQNNPSKSSNPFQPPSPSPHLPSQNPIFKTPSMPNMEIFHLGSVPMASPINGDGGFDAGWPSFPVHGNVNFPKLLNPCEVGHDQKGENSNSSRLDHGLHFHSKWGLPYENYPIGPLPHMVPRTQQYQQSSSSLVNVSSINSSSPSMLNFPMEPPSNQSYYGNFTPLWPDEEKMMVGMKRACPFPLDHPPIPTFHSKFVPLAAHLISRSDESTSSGNGNVGTTFNLDPTIPIFRDPLCPSMMPERPNSKKISRSENGNFHGGILTLAPPAPTLPFTSSRFKQPSIFTAPLSGDFCSFENLPYRGSVENSFTDSGLGGSSQPANFFSFFPPTKVQVASTSSPAGHNSCNGEVEESIDLNLRL